MPCPDSSAKSQRSTLLGTLTWTSATGTKKPPCAAPAFATLNNSGWFQVVTSNGGLSTPPATNQGNQSAALVYWTVQLKSFWNGSITYWRSIPSQDPPQPPTRNPVRPEPKVFPSQTSDVLPWARAA